MKSIWLRAKWMWCDFLTWLGVCHRCGRVFSHDDDGPFAYCGCGTTEWCSKPGLLPRILGRGPK